MLRVTIVRTDFWIVAIMRLGELSLILIAAKLGTKKDLVNGAVDLSETCAQACLLGRSPPPRPDRRA